MKSIKERPSFQDHRNSFFHMTFRVCFCSIPTINLGIQKRWYFCLKGAKRKSDPKIHYLWRVWFDRKLIYVTGLLGSWCVSNWNKRLMYSRQHWMRQRYTWEGARKRERQRFSRSGYSREVSKGRRFFVRILMGRSCRIRIWPCAGKFGLCARRRCRSWKGEERE